MKGASYETADNLAILPENDPIKITEFCKHLNINHEQYFVLTPPKMDSQDNEDISITFKKENEFKHMYPTPCTVLEAFTKYYDFSVSNVLSFNSYLNDYINNICIYIIYII